MSQPLDRQLAGQLTESLTRTFRVLRRMVVEAARAEGLSHSQFLALRHLGGMGELRMSELASHLDLTNSATTLMIEKLEGRALAHRRVDPADGRGVLVSATREGEALARSVQQHGHEILYRAFERLGQPERHMVLGGMAALETALEAVSGDASP